MSTTSFPPAISGSSGPILRSLAQSTATTTRSARSSGGVRVRPPRSRKPYSAGSGPSPERYMSTSLPSARRPSVVASREPSASPSGFSCVTTTKRSCDRSASATPVTSSILCPILRELRGELVDQLGHADAPLDRVIVSERQHGRPPERELAVDLRLEHSPRRLEPLERLAPLAFAAEDGHVDPRLLEVGRDRDAGDGDETDARVLELADALRDDRAHRFVHPSHPVRHGAPR